jgi:hypothetical protein
MTRSMYGRSTMIMKPARALPRRAARCHAAPRVGTLARAPR